MFLLQFVLSKSYGAVPHDSTAGVPAWFTPIGLGVLLYLGIRVYFALRRKK